MCTRPVAGARDATSALTGLVLQSPAAMTSTLATVAAGIRAVVARRQEATDLGAPIDLMFICYLPGGPDNDAVERDCPCSRRL